LHYAFDVFVKITKGQALIIIGILCALAFLLFGRTIDYPFVRFDDGLLIYDNPAIRGISLTNIKTAFSTYDPELYIPLTLISYQVDFLIGGIKPAIYHLQNILWHAANGVLVTWLMYALLKARDQWQIANGKLQIVSLFLGMLFIAHPLNVEAVAWASARKDLLSTFFALASILSYLQWRSSDTKRYFYGSLALFTLGLLCKVTILTLPVLLLLVDLWAKRKIDKAMFLEKIPFFALSGVFAVIAIIGKAGQIGSVTPMETILVTSKATAFTLQQYFLPFGFSVLYPFNETIAVSDPRFVIPLLGLLGLIGLLCFLALKKRILPPILALGFFLIALSPSLLNFAKGGTVYITSDRYAYFAQVGILLGLGMGILHFLRGDVRLGGRLYRKRLPMMVAVLLIGILATLSIRQTKTWASSEALFAHAVKVSPDSHVAHTNLGNVFTERKAEGNLAEAIIHYEEALQIAQSLPYNAGPTDPVTSKILSNLGSALRQSGGVSKAVRRYEEAIEKNPQNPYAFLGLGIIAATEGRMGEAETQYRTALEIAPKFSPAYLNLGALFSATGRYEEALASFDEGIVIDPFAPQAHFNRGVVLQKLNRLAEARNAYAYAVELAPSFVAARINLGILEANRGKHEEAIQQFREVLRYDPGNTKALEALRQLQ